MRVNRRHVLLPALGLVTGASFLAARGAAAADSYEYDALGQLKKVTYDNGTVVQYLYDAAGNRTWYVTTPSGTSYSAEADSLWWQGEEDLPGTPANAAPVTAVPTAGTPGYSFLWQRVSGSTLISALSPTSASTKWTLNGNGHVSALYSAVWRCRVTDSASNVTYTSNVGVDVTRYV